MDVDFLTVGASNVDAFLGLNGGTDDAFGLEVTGVDFGLALISDREGMRSWTVYRPLVRVLPSWVLTI